MLTKLELKVKDLLYLGIIATILMLWLRSGTQPQNNLTLDDVKEYWEQQDFKPDTQVLNVEYPNIIFPDYPTYVPPNVVVNYKASDNSNFLDVTDSLLRVIDAKNQELAAINKTFLTQYPKASKLITGHFDEDTIKLDLLLTDGNISRFLYPVNYKRFSYQYQENQLKAQEKDLVVDNPIAKFKQNFHHSFSIYGNYELLYDFPTLGFNYRAQYKKVWVQAEPKIFFAPQRASPAFEIGVGYSIFSNH